MPELAATTDVKVRAKLSQVRISPQKARLVADQIRLKRVGEAFDLLHFSTKKAAVILHKLLASAVANAEHNHNWDADDLYITEIFIDGGPVLKRVRFRARGRMDRITKATSHITISLAQSVKRAIDNSKVAKPKKSSAVAKAAKST